MAVAGLPSAHADRRLAVMAGTRLRPGLARAVRRSAADPGRVPRADAALGGWILTPLDPHYPRALHAIEEAFAHAYKKEYGKRGQIVRCHFSADTGATTFEQVKLVVDENTVRFREEGEEEETDEKENRREFKMNFLLSLCLLEIFSLILLLPYFCMYAI